MLNTYKNLTRFKIKTGISCQQRASFFAERKNIFKDLSEEDKINIAISHSEIEDAEIGFLKGVGFFNLGPGYELDSIKAFEKAISLDTDKVYKDDANKYLKQLRKN